MKGFFVYACYCSQAWSRLHRPSLNLQILKKALAL